MEVGGRIKEYFKFEKREVTGIVISVLIIAFILSFKDWGTEKFDVVSGVNNLAATILIVSLAYIVHVSVQKIYALKMGYLAEFQYSLYGLIIGLVLCFASNGFLFFLGSGEVQLRHVPRWRVGKFRYGLNYWDYAKISFAGPMANVFLAIFFKMLSWTGSPLIEKAILANILIAIFSLVPVPGNDGLNLFFGSKPFYAFSVGTIVGISMLLLYVKIIWLSILMGFIMGLITSFIFFVIVEKGLEVT
jgi:hypothetical protein